MREMLEHFLRFCPALSYHRYIEASQLKGLDINFEKSVDVLDVVSFSSYEQISGFTKEL